MVDKTEISFPDGGMVDADSGMSFHSCTKRDYHYLYKENKDLRARNAELEAEVARLRKALKNICSFFAEDSHDFSYTIAKEALEANDE